MAEAVTMPSRTTRILIITACITAAVIFLFFRLGKGDPVTDEVELAFRAIGYMDFLATPFQTTPLEWFKDAPWWTKLTFHDHPPVIFALGHAMFNAFGDSLLILRVPFAILGLASLLLIYFLTKKIFGDSTALIALAASSVNTYLTWIGRIGLQEELVIFFTLLSLFFLIKAESKPIYFFFWGAALGVGLLSKYTSAIIVPVSFLYLWYFNRAGLKNKNLYLGILLALVIFSLILVYNWQMYQAVGHFDLQFSSFLGQDVSAHWQSLLGKDIGSLGERLVNFYPSLWNNDLPLVIFFIPSLLFLIYQYIRGRLGASAKFVFWTAVLYHLLILVIGPSQRFLVMLAAWAIIAIAYVLNEIWKRNRLVFGILIAIFLLYQGLYNSRTNLAYATDSSPIWHSSKLRIESADYGYNELENYLRELLDSKKPAVSLGLPEKLKFIEKYRQKDYRGTAGNPEAPYLIIYDPRVNQVAKLWLYDRRYYYDGWPFVSVDEYLQIQKIAPQYFTSLGISDVYYIASTPETFLGGYALPASQDLDLGIPPEREIVNHSGKTVFRIYRFSL